MRVMLLNLALVAAHGFAQNPAVGAPAANAKPLAFDVVSIKPAKPGKTSYFGFGPTGYSAAAVPLSRVIRQAYFAFNMAERDFLIGAPRWVDNDLWDIETKVAPEDMAGYEHGRLRRDEANSVGQQMLRSMLADRFQLVLHQVPAQMDGYALAVAKTGAKLKEAAADEPQPSGSIFAFDGGYMVPYQRGDLPHMTFYSVTTAGLAMQLRGLAGGPVVDRTGLSGRYDFRLDWLSSGPDEEHVGSIDFDDPEKLSHWNLGALGLRADHVKVPTEHIVIDSVSRPSEN